ncbi:uncharacterized protein LOC120007350 [Tripterygium wilfordii]|uniref:uncharacterized protein LOC120007350 n=1 Tax=Tripterygium wilfordii TaxID=458696 RepID=UPI0018F84B19|nr:uncharacterized protein LOC120007350 [Tripterygium wilfordii]
MSFQICKDVRVTSDTRHQHVQIMPAHMSNQIFSTSHSSLCAKSFTNFSMDHPNASSEILREFIAFDSDSEDDLEQLFNAEENDDQQANGRRQTGHHSSILGHRIVQRNHVDGHFKLWNDYFKPDPVYHEGLFRRRFQMSRIFFLHIANVVAANDAYFAQRRNVVGVLGLSALQKITAAIRILAYGSPADTLDEYI